ncbi:CBS domain-containing protein [Fuchsiella alkaliacetigena]|uniref:CBS domain-containing protein n=1 Tax=Fuchsiella alkaliacetigena TaxID=957042 RepID=UPI00200AC32D|nr:CBS domain-containing protein [Fuchsiella alkaliacetigena]MCK8825720.1 CBS domain-containing protein [Fuchsiella alkaliacetigena]
MELITGHEGADFDSLAAMVAANKLYPRATMVFSGRLNAKVRDFMSLYKDRIEIKKLREISPVIENREVERLIVVDTRVANRLGKLEAIARDPEVELIIYDHHPEGDDDLIGDWQRVETVGATTTLLCQEIKGKKLEITPFEATLFALGIYTDTGSLMFNSTTALDAEMVSYLLAQEANLAVIKEFIERSLSTEQQELFSRLLNSLTVHEFNGFKVNIYQAEVEKYIGGIAYLTHKLDDLNRADAVFTLVRMEGKVLIVARSNVDMIDVARVMREYDGGGHARAASAMFQDQETSLTEIEAQLMSLVRQKVEPVILAKDIMSSPVKTIKPDKSITQAEKKMLRYGHSGLIVTEADEIVGVISRRDVDKVREHDLMHAPVKGYMSREVISISKDYTFKQIQRKMIENDIGRLPVVDEEGKLVGIVTRSDILRLLYGEADYIKGQQNRYGRSIVSVAEEKYDLQKELENLAEELGIRLGEMGELADELGIDLYIVGGFVRDMLLDIDNLDLDLVVEGDGILFAKELAQRLDYELKEVHSEFKTATLLLADGLELDIASARIEYYDSPAALPKVELASLKEDLFRRDFTINALAIQLNSSHFGKLVDFFGGLEDLEMGVVRALHNCSFIDDPTRIFRALKFANRYDFELDALTKELINHALEQDILAGVSYGRISNELCLILQEDNPAEILRDLESFRVFEHLYPGLSWERSQHKRALEVPWALKWLQDLEFKKEIKLWQIYLLLLLDSLAEEEVRDFLLKLKFSNDIIDKALFIKGEAEKLLSTLASAEIKPYTVYNSLEPLSIEEIIYLLLLSEGPQIKEWIKKYLVELRKVELSVSGKDIISLGYKPGPYFAEVLAEVKEEKLNGNLSTSEDELRYLRGCLMRFERERVE